MPIAPSFSSVFCMDWEINFMQCSPNGNLKYTEMCNLLQLTAAGHAQMGGISFLDMQEFNQAWVLSRMRVEITELPKWRDRITIKTWINSLENSRSVRALEIFVNNKKVIGAETFWAVFNTQIRRPEALALPYNHFELYPQKKATLVSFSKITVPQESEVVVQKTVYLSDLDIVNHVNNVKYLEWCLDFVDSEIILNQKLESFEMNFIKELSLHEVVTIHENSNSKSTIFSVKKKNNNCFALQLNWK